MRTSPPGSGVTEGPYRQGDSFATTTHVPRAGVDGGGGEDSGPGAALAGGGLGAASSVGGTGVGVGCEREHAVATMGSAIAKKTLIFIIF